MFLRMLFVLCLVHAPGLLAAAEKAGTQVLFDAKPLYPTQGGPGIKWAGFPGSSATLVGGVGGLLVGERWNIGVGSYSLSSELVTSQAGVPRDVGMSYGGVSLGASFYPRRLFYFNVATLVGYGQAWGISRRLGAQRDVAAFAILEPEFCWVVNFTKEVRLATSLSLRIIRGADLGNTVGMNLEGTALGFTLLYGRL